MEDIPKSTRRYYEWFIISHPESWHPTTLDFFYLFLGALFANSKKDRTQGWLEKNLKEDCPQLSEEDIRKYGEIYKHIRDFKKFPKTQTAHLLAKSMHEENMKEARRKYKKEKNIKI